MINELGEVQYCRVCRSPNWSDVLDLGEQSYTGRFIRPEDDDPACERLAIVRCDDCGLIMLKDTFPGDEMYGETYAYRSAVTQTMRDHLREISEYALENVISDGAPRVLDIGSNDGTQLANYAGRSSSMTGIDPCANKHIDNYPDGATAVTNFFSRANLEAAGAPTEFDIVTSIAMFYDLDDPVDFASNIRSVLAPNGIWITEQTHSHTLIEVNAYDSICHEHVTYLSFDSMERICAQAGLRIIDVTTNDMNGGSFCALIVRDDAPERPVREENLAAFRATEQALNLDQVDVWTKFAEGVHAHRDALNSTLQEWKDRGELIFGLGASTKGNVILQHCGITPDLMPAIIERDPRKFGLVTPRTRIPIISEDEGRAQNPGLLVVFPWHFRDEIIKREREYLESGGTLLFPLPNMEMVTAESLK